jgi:hypothetical protein
MSVQPSNTDSPCSLAQWRRARTNVLLSIGLLVVHRTEAEGCFFAPPLSSSLPPGERGRGKAYVQIPSPLVGEGQGEGAVSTTLIQQNQCDELLLVTDKGRSPRQIAAAVDMDSLSSNERRVVRQ